MCDDEKNARLRESLERLTERVKSVCQSALEEGLPVCREVTVPWLKFPAFINRETRFYCSHYIDYVNKTICPDVMVQRLFDDVERTSEYLAARSCFEQCNLGGADRKCFVEFVYHSIKETAAPDQPSALKMIESFCKFINGEPIQTSASLQLDGLNIRTDPISFSIKGTEFLLRRTTREDVEKELDPIKPDPYPAVPPRIILEISGIMSREDIRNELLRSHAILLLFGLSSVRMRSCKIDGWSFDGVDPSARNNNWLLYGYTLEEDSPEKMIRFWTGISDHLPPGFYASETQELDYLSVAFQRYRDAVLSTPMPERQIVEAMTALESLLLENDGELSFRLQMRVAKTLGILGFDASEVRERLAKAYKLRSRFVHSGHLSAGEKKKPYKFDDGILRFAQILLHYVRVCLVMAVLLGRENRKIDLIQLIDASLIDDNKSRRLGGLLGQVKETLGPMPLSTWEIPGSNEDGHG